MAFENFDTPINFAAPQPIPMQTQGMNDTIMRMNQLQQQQQVPQVPQVNPQRAMLEQELRANEARIAELEAKIDGFDAQAMQTANEYDLRMAENRARRGDLGNSIWHWARPAQREQTALNRKNDLESKISDLDAQIGKLRIARSYENGNRQAADTYDQQIAALEAKKAALMKRAGIKPTTVSVATPTNDNVKYKQEAMAKYEGSIFKGEDGKMYLKDGINPEELKDDLKSIPHWKDDPEVMKAIRQIDETRSVNAALSANNIDNLKTYSAKPEKYKSGLWADDAARNEFRKMWDALAPEQRETPEAQEMKKKYYSAMTKKEYAAYLNDMDKAGQEALKGQPDGIRAQIKEGLLSKFTDPSTGREWTRRDNGTWFSKGWKRGK